MTSNGSRDEEFQPVRHVKDEYKGDVNIVVGEKPGSQRYNELQINKGGGDMSVVHQNFVSQPPHQQPQGSLIHWERFLHVESIKVMLVEDDDSTRHIVTALLRNCNYEVIEAANGFQAWKILEDLSNHIDIVLTEVIMPSLSGIGLLCKIMSHKTRKNIPVIMMSSHDSMGLVFKCLSKGAVDFLLKPIRKNELKNLWQHVWRRCHSSSGSGSGSESSTNAQNSVNSKRSDDSVSIVGDDIRSTHDGSDDASGTQSSWTKQVASPCDSTCGLVIHSAEIKTRDLQGREEQRNYTRKGKELVTEEFEVVKEPKNILDESRETLTDLNGPNKHSEPSAFTRYSTTTSNQKSGDVPKDDMVDPPQVYHIHHHHHVHHYHKQPPGNLEDSSLKKLRACGSSNVLGGGGGNIGNYSLNGSGGSGSKHGSNAVNLESKNMESGGELAGKSGGENRIDQQKSEQRESSLVKFREKRKDGCFQKKVRYKNKKRLAEERPHESS